MTLNKNSVPLGISVRKARPTGPKARGQWDGWDGFRSLLYDKGQKTRQETHLKSTRLIWAPRGT